MNVPLQQRKAIRLILVKHEAEKAEKFSLDCCQMGENPRHVLRPPPHRGDWVAGTFAFGGCNYVGLWDFFILRRRQREGHPRHVSSDVVCVSLLSGRRCE